MGVSQEDAVEVLVSIRIAIEGSAFRHTLPLLSPAEFQALGELVARMRVAAARNDLDELADADARFHELVVERSGQPHCLQIWRLIEPLVRANLRRDAPAHPRPEEVADEHDELVRALMLRDEALVMSSLERHILNSVGPR